MIKEGQNKKLWYFFGYFICCFFVKCLFNLNGFMAYFEKKKVLADCVSWLIQIPWGGKRNSTRGYLFFIVQSEDLSEEACLHREQKEAKEIMQSTGRFWWGVLRKWSSCKKASSRRTHRSKCRSGRKRGQRSARGDHVGTWETLWGLTTFMLVRWEATGDSELSSNMIRLVSFF